MSHPVIEKNQIVFNGLLIDFTKSKNIEIELKQKATELQRTNKKYETIVSSTGTGFWSFNINEVSLWCSHEYSSILGINPIDLNSNLHSNFLYFIFDRIHPDDQELTKKNFYNYINTPDNLFELIFRIRHNDGHYIWLCTRGKGQKESNGIINEIWGTYIDISEQKKIEGNLKESELRNKILNERFSLAAESASLGIWDIDLIDRSVIWNDYMYKMLDLDVNISLEYTKTFLKNVHPDDIELIKNEFNNCLSGKNIFNCSYRIITPDKDIRHLKSLGKAYHNI